MNSVSPSTMPRMAAFRRTIIERRGEDGAWQGSWSPRAYTRSRATDQSVEQLHAGHRGGTDRHRHRVRGARDADPPLAARQDDTRRRAQPLAEELQRRAGGGWRARAGRQTLEADPHEPKADDRLPGSGGGAGADAIVGVGAGTDHGRVAHPAPRLAREAAGRRRRRDSSAPVTGDRADGLARRIASSSPALARGRGDQRLRRDERQPMLAGTLGGRRADQQHLASLL